MARIVFVSRSVDVASGGGIGAYITAQARLLSECHEVTVISPASNARLLQAAFNDVPRVETLALDPLPPAASANCFGELHAWSVCVWEAIKDRFAGNPPDYIEFPDYLGEGAVTIQARRTGHPLLRSTKIGVRAYTTAEMCDVLNGTVDRVGGSTLVHDLERYALANADCFVHAGGDLVGMFDRFFDGDVAPPVLVRHAIGFQAAPRPPRVPDGVLRLLYIGRLERRKGVHRLVEAAAGARAHPFELTLVGSDTRTGPAGTSMRELLETSGDGDRRIVITNPVAHDRIPELIETHDAVIVPSLWECWPNVGLEALGHNRPLLATPVGGLSEMVVDGETGFAAGGTSVRDLEDLLERAVDERQRLFEMTAARAPYAHFERIASRPQVMHQYDQVANGESRDRHSRARSRRPLVSVIVPYFRLDQFVSETVTSVLRQSYRPIEVIVVNDGSFRANDRVLQELSQLPGVRVAHKPNGGLGSARNFGVMLSRGEYILPLDADNLVEPEMIEWCVDVLEADPDLAFVSTWSKYVDEQNEELGVGVGYSPIGNQARWTERGNVAADAASVVRRSVFELGHRYSEELTSYEDWFFYRELRRAGRIGHVIPERLVRYRVRADSMLRTDGEEHLASLERTMDSLMIEGSMQWTCPSV